MEFYGVEFNVNKLLRILAVLLVATLISYSFTHVIYYDSYTHIFHLLKISVITAIFVVAYIVLLPLLRAIGLGDLNNIRAILNSIRLLKPIFRPLIDFEEKLVRITSR